MFFDRNGKRCKNFAIKSHSLQRRGPLSRIAEDNHVIKVGQELRAAPIGKRSNFEKVGLKKASTFAGFCANHDTEIFKPIEDGDFELNIKNALVSAVRALALECNRKSMSIAIQKETIAFLGSKASPETIQNLKWALRGARKAEVANLIWLRRLFAAYHKEIPKGFLFRAFKFDAHLPFACTGAFEPEWSAKKAYLFNSDPIKLKWNIVSLLAGNFGKQGFAIFFGIQRYHAHRIDKFLGSIEASAEDQASQILTLALMHSENCYLRESWKNALSSDEVAKIVALSQSGLLEGTRDPQMLDVRVPIANIKLLELATNV
jgi:hypothetical protein